MAHITLNKQPLVSMTYGKARTKFILTKYTFKYLHRVNVFNCLACINVNPWRLCPMRLIAKARSIHSWAFPWLREWEGREHSSQWMRPTQKPKHKEETCRTSRFASFFLDGAGCSCVNQFPT